MDSNDVYSLDQLHDIVIPAAPSPWPPSTLALVLLGMAAVMVLIAFWQGCLWWRANAYRRAGQMLLQEARTVYDVSVTLKRVAMAVFSRAEVAALYGSDWVDFLNRNSTRPLFKDTELLDAQAPASPGLLSSADTWIRTHRPPRSESAQEGCVRC